MAKVSKILSKRKEMVIIMKKISVKSKAIFVIQQ